MMLTGKNVPDVRSEDRTYRIASFNLFKFSNNGKKDYPEICRLINENSIDILAIQEIFTEHALENLLNNLNPARWEGRWASPDSRSVSAAEGYAFIWNKERISLSRNRSGKVFEPVIHNQYPHKDVGELIRNPFYGRFIAVKNEMVEFRIINTHIMFSKNRTINEDDDRDSATTNVSDITMRKREFDILSSKILPKLDDKAYDSQWNEDDMLCRKPYTILLGDYNLNLKGSGAGSPYIDEPLIVINDGISEKRIITVQNELTTLRSKSQESKKIDGLRNNFDHFTYDETRPIQTRCWTVDSTKQFGEYFNDYDKYKEKVSDHLMVVLEINFV